MATAHPLSHAVRAELAEAIATEAATLAQEQLTTQDDGDVNAASRALLAAVKAGNHARVCALLDAGRARPDDVCALHWAAAHEQHDADLHAMRLLIDARADIDLRHPDGGTPLLWACRSDAESAVAMLLAAGADPSRAMRNGVTPLHEAALWEMEGAVRALIAAKADINAANDAGETPLHFGVDARLPGSMDALLEAGADTTRRNDSGYTPLMIAACLGHEGLLRRIAAARRRAIAVEQQVDAAGE